MLKNLYLICGKSGSGKTWVTDKLHDKYGYQVLKSYTTRPRRHPLDDDHIYVTISDYYEDKRNNLIAADTCFDQNLYWSKLSQLSESDIYVIDKKGIESLGSLVNFWRNLVVIYIDCSEDVRIKHMKMRGDSQKDIYKRLSNDEEEFSGIEKIADFIVNGDNDDKWMTINNIIERCEKVAEKLTRKG